MGEFDKVVTGVNLGDYEFIPETILDVAEKYGYGKYFKWASIRCDVTDIEEHYYYEWAQYFKEHGIYFEIENSQRSTKLVKTGKKSFLTKEIVSRIKEIAGEYFLGATLGEFGSTYAFHAKGYRRHYSEQERKEHWQAAHPVQGFDNLQEARDTYVESERQQLRIMQELGVRSVSNQPVALLEYDFEAGIKFPIIEVIVSNMEQILSFGRGAIRAYGKSKFGCWLAHEWYGGYRMDDPLKAKRFPMEYLYCYLSGAGLVQLESGYRAIRNHGFRLEEEHPMTQSYLREAQKFAVFCDTDDRPSKGPIVKTAFVKGNLDGFGCGFSSSVWGQFEKEEWGYASAEHSYRILDEVYRRRDWHDTANFGEYDFSHAPAYGQYDVVPAVAPLSVLADYDWLIFTGWNTMTEELFHKLKAYVVGGGKLLIGACHLRNSIERDQEGTFVCREEYEEFFGCEITDEKLRTNDGYKFAYESTIEGLRYPGPPGMKCDPAWSAGYTDYVKIRPGEAFTVCVLSDNFSNDAEFTFPVVTEHSYGKGNVIFMANADYPGAPQVYPLYRMIVKEILAATHRLADLKVLCNDSMRFAVYEDEVKYKVYLLNTDFNFEQKARVLYHGQETETLVPSAEMVTVELSKAKTSTTVEGRK